MQAILMNQERAKAMKFPSTETVERLKKEYPAGCRIVLDDMDDPFVKIPVGTQGTVKWVDDAGSITPVWDSGGSLSIVYGVDQCHKIRTDSEASVTLGWYGKKQSSENARCPRCGELMDGPTTRHALSRRADVMICDSCGLQEALEDAGIMDKLPMMQWEYIKHIQTGGGEWK